MCFPECPKAKPTMSPIPDPRAATTATKSGLNTIPPATTVAIAGAGKNKVAEPMIFIINIPIIPRDPK